MTVAIVHYHLRRGGVTRVIEAQSTALQSAGVDHVILAGSAYQGSLHLPVVLVPDLDYRTHPSPGLTAELREAARKALGGSPDLWHLHNPTLGKNSSFPSLIEDLLAEGQHLLLQHHDFAEDGRPRNYQLLDGHAHLYPLAPQAHFAFLNSRDRNLLIDAGLPAARCHLLPNAVTPPVVPPGNPTPPGQRLVLYPVRGIRRKNIGELCLLAALAPAHTRFALTLDPENPQWLKFYRRWVRFARKHQLPVLFGVAGSLPPAPGADPGFESWLQHSTHLMTCSIAEGFGLAFLEPVALRKPLLGRDLPEITVDFTSRGLDLGALYEDLLIPLDWIDLQALRSRLERNLRKSYDAYHSTVDEEILERAWDALLLGDFADFGNLPEAIQRPVIERALQRPDEVMVGIGGECLPLTDWLEDALARTEPAAERSALDPWSLQRYTRNLLACYEATLADAPAPPDWLPPAAVLEQFLEPERFHFLRT